MLLQSDIKDYLRDLMYLEEDALNALKINPDICNQNCKKIYDNIVEKQIIITKMIDLINTSEINENEPN